MDLSEAQRDVLREILRQPVGQRLVMRGPGGWYVGRVTEGVDPIHGMVVRALERRMLLRAREDGSLELHRFEAAELRENE